MTENLPNLVVEKQIMSFSDECSTSLKLQTQVEKKESDNAVCLMDSVDQHCSFSFHRPIWMLDSAVVIDGVHGIVRRMGDESSSSESFGGSHAMQSVIYGWKLTAECK